MLNQTSSFTNVTPNVYYTTSQPHPCPRLFSSLVKPDMFMFAAQSAHQTATHIIENFQTSFEDKIKERISQEEGGNSTLIRLAIEVEKITNDPSLTDKEKRRLINEKRKEYGLSKKEMKKEITKKLQKIYQDLGSELKTQKDQLTQEIRLSQSNYGSQSTQAIIALQKRQALSPVMETLQKRCDNNTSLYKSMYKAGGCIKKALHKTGGFFKSLGQGLVKNWLKLSFWTQWVLPITAGLIPGVGPLVSTAYRWAITAKRAFDAAKQFIKDPSQLLWNATLPYVNWVPNKINQVYNRGLERLGAPPPSD